MTTCKKQPNNFLRLVFTPLTKPTSWNNDIKATRAVDIYLKTFRHNFILIVFIMHFFLGIIGLCRARKTLINFFTTLIPHLAVTHIYFIPLSTFVPFSKWTHFHWYYIIPDKGRSFVFINICLNILLYEGGVSM